MNIERPDLTNDEIKSLSFEMKICFMLQGWNKGINPTTVDDWAKLVGWFAYRDYDVVNDRETPYEIAVKHAKEDAEKKINFLSKFL